MKVIEWDSKSLYLALKKAEALLMDIKTTGSHYQIKEKINNYFKETNKGVIYERQENQKKKIQQEKDQQKKVNRREEKGE